MTGACPYCSGPEADASHLASCPGWREQSPLAHATQFLLDRNVHPELIQVEVLAALNFLESLTSFVPPPESSLFTCQLCGAQQHDFESVVFLNCDHLLCRAHLVEYITAKHPDPLFCLVKDCHHPLSYAEIADIIPATTLQELDSRALTSFLSDTSNIIQCSKCNTSVFFEEGKVENMRTDNLGRVLSQEAAQHFAKNRFRCICNHECCIECNTSPYHLGFTCQQYTEYIDSRKCRYCMTSLNSSTPHCQKVDCVSKLENSCTNILECNHQCSSVQGATCFCLECCPSVDGSDFCPMCFVDPLDSADNIILLSCGHAVHFECIKSQFERKWYDVSAQITFSFAHCPLCKTLINVDHPELANHVSNTKALMDDVQDKAHRRLNFENRQLDDDVTNPASEFYQKPLEYSLSLYMYFECFKCKSPYFGGLKECNVDLPGELSREDLVCPPCSGVVHSSDNCPTHGSEYISFKCRFCCKVAAFFCHGDTHYCWECHKKPGDVQKLAKKNSLPPCPGAQCSLKTPHPQPGNEFCLGCGVCREQVDF
ncbi:hypothetical protein GEMRC1_006082 [Eukaryota sp. GEM-RC1]